MPRFHLTGALYEDGLLILFSAFDGRLHRRLLLLKPTFTLNGNRLEFLAPPRQALGDPQIGGAAGTRTPDLLNAIEMRSQLRYSPI